MLINSILAAPLQRALPTVSAWDSSAFQSRHQGSVAARCSGVDAGDPLCREARDIVRAAGFGACAAETLPAKWLAFDHGADLVAVDIEVSDPRMLLDIVADGVDPALQAKSEPVPGRVDVIDDFAQV